MESARLHPLSKPQAIVAMLTFATLVVGGIWRKADYEIYQIAGLYLLGIPALLLTMMFTPTQADYAKGLYRAQKQGKTRLPWWDDLSLNWVGLVLIAGIVLAAGTIAGTVAAGTPSPSAFQKPGPYPLALAAAVLTVAYFGLAFQFFHAPLRQARRDVLRPVHLRRLAPADRRRLDPVDGVRVRCARMKTSAPRSSP